MKNKAYILLLFIGTALSCIGQIAPNTLLGLPGALETDINLTTPSLGSMVYNTDDNHAYVYTGSTFEKLIYGTDTYTGTFQVDAAGAKVITGLPFQPSSIIFEAYMNVEDFVMDTDNGGAENDRGIINSFGFMYGFARDDAGTTVEQVICNGGSGTSINDITRYASDSNCIGLRYSDQNGNDLGKITGVLDSFDANGFTLNITYTLGTITVNNADPILDVQPEDINDEGVIIMYTAYR